MPEYRGPDTREQAGGEGYKRRGTATGTDRAFPPTVLHLIAISAIAEWWRLAGS